MQTIRGLVDSLAAGATSANVLAGNRFEFLPRTQHVSFYAICHLEDNTASVAGVTNAVSCTLSFGNVVLIDGGRIPPATGGLKRNEHMLNAGIGQAGDRLILTVTNGTGVIVDVPFMLELSDL